MSEDAEHDGGLYRLGTDNKQAASAKRSNSTSAPADTSTSQSYRELQEAQLMQMTSFSMLPAISDTTDQTPLREQDRLLPAANVARLMSHALPEGAKISRDAKRLMQESLSEFISFLTSEVNDKCQSAQRRVMTGKDFVDVLNNVGLDKFAPGAAAALPLMSRGSKRPANSLDTDGQGCFDESAGVGANRRSHSTAKKPPAIRALTNAEW